MRRSPAQNGRVGGIAAVRRRCAGCCCAKELRLARWAKCTHQPLETPSGRGGWFQRSLRNAGNISSDHGLGFWAGARQREMRRAPMVCATGSRVVYGSRFGVGRWLRPATMGQLSAVPSPLPCAPSPPPRSIGNGCGNACADACRSKIPRRCVGCDATSGAQPSVASTIPGPAAATASAARCLDCNRLIRPSLRYWQLGWTRCPVGGCVFG